jgi:hypothetical protein
MKTFKTRATSPYTGIDIQSASNNYAYELGFRYNFLMLEQNMFYLNMSYYKALSYEESLHFTNLDYIFDKIKVGLSYNYKNDFSTHLSYEKFIDSYKNSFAMGVAKNFIKSEYFSSQIGYEYRRDIEDSADYSYTYNNIQYLHLIDTFDLLDTEKIFYYKIKITFSDMFDTAIDFRFIDSKIYGKYTSYGIGFNL